MLPTKDCQSTIQGRCPDIIPTTKILYHLSTCFVKVLFLYPKYRRVI
nr:MAG TPA: hypothetical protein [Caudoviricetes sp.]DAZ36537.1 MAG TPA: hypothetical protein [Caudoviricetes sp.]